MKRLLSVVLGIFLFPLAYGHPKFVSLAGENLKFTYQSFEGEESIHCTHSVENAAGGDWKVLCQKENFKREYGVHLWVTQYHRAQAPRTSFETLYWVSERFPRSNAGYSQTNWMHLEEESDFSGASLSVGVDNESAGLYLEISKH